MVAITIDHLVKRFGATLAVNDISLTIPAGALFFLLGPSGCGKTTLLRMIAGFTASDGGRILFGDQDMTAVPPYKRDTGMVFQSYALWPHMTVAANVAFGLEIRGIPKPERARRVEEALQLVQMAHLADRKPAQLSGGQQQRVALARALAIRPRCLLLDEPLSNLDAKLRSEMRSEIRRIVKATGLTAIYVTHDQKEALAMADGIAVLRGGKLEQTGGPEELYRRPASQFVADFLGESNFLDGTVRAVLPDAIAVQTAAGTLDARPGPRSWNVGDRVLVAVRPEAVQVASGLWKDGPGIAGTRKSTVYLGDVAEHLVQLPGEVVVKSFELNPHPSATPSTACRVSVAPENVMLLPPSV